MQSVASPAVSPQVIFITPQQMNNLQQQQQQQNSTTSSNVSTRTLSSYVPFLRELSNEKRLS